jgi:hypothetical protein
MEKLFKIGDRVQIMPGASYLSGKEVPADILNLKLYIRAVKDSGYTVARAQTGAVLGDIAEDDLKDISVGINAIQPYVIKTTVNDAALYHSPSKNSGVIRRINRGLYTIIDEKNGFGKIRVGKGWIELAKVVKM